MRELVLASARQVDRDHANREARNVARENVARPVDDATALGQHRQPHDPVLLREIVVVIAADDLEVVQPSRQRGEDDDDRGAERDEPSD